MIMLSHIIDYKSRSTAAHSSTVAACTVINAQYPGFNQVKLKMIKYVGYIHNFISNNATIKKEWISILIKTQFVEEVL
jgi:hypothetical protein